MLSLKIIIQHIPNNIKKLYIPGRSVTFLIAPAAASEPSSINEAAITHTYQPTHLPYFASLDPQADRQWPALTARSSPPAALTWPFMMPTQSRHEKSSLWRSNSERHTLR